MKTIPTALPPAGQARLQDRKHAHSFPFHQPRRSLTAKAWGLLSFLWLCAGLSTALAANLLTNPGFEDGQNGWSNPNLVRGGTSLVITDPAIAHTGNNCISNYNAGGWSSAEQGDARGGWGTGVSLPVSDAKYYKLSAWVKVPGASAAPQDITLRYRFEPSANRVDVGLATVSTEAWTFLESGWIAPAPGDTYMGYWEVHSVANAVAFFADDCALEESIGCAIAGVVKDDSGNPVVGAQVQLKQSGAVLKTTTSLAGGAYTLIVAPVAGVVYDLNASKLNYTSPFLDVSVTTVAVPGVATAADLILTAQPMITLSGIVTSTATGLPVADARITIVGSSGTLRTNTGANGRYSLMIAANQAYDVTASRLPLSAPSQWIAPTADTTLNFGLSSALLVGVYADSLTAGPLTTWTNAGTLGGQFDLLGATPPVASAQGQFKAVNFNNNPMVLSNRSAGTLVTAPALITGPTANYTVCAWLFEPDPVLPDQQTYIAWAKRGGPNGSNCEMVYGINGTWGAAGHWGDPDMPWGTPPTGGAWHNVIVTWDSTAGVESAYIDGVFSKSETKTLDLPPDLPIVLGSGYWWDGTIISPDIPFSGFIAQVEIFGAAATAEDAARLASLSPPPLPSATIQGKVVTTDASAPSGFEITVTDAAGTVQGRAVTGAGGTYSLVVPAPGTFTVKAAKLSYVTLPAPQTRTVAVSETVTLGDFTAIPSTIHGLVVDATTGAPIYNAVIQVGGGGGQAMVTSQDGAYSLAGIGCGGIEIFADALGYHCKSLVVTGTGDVLKRIALTPEAETGVITNGGFETVMADQPTDWSEVWTAGGLVYSSSTNAFSGAYSVWYSGVASFSALAQYVPTTPGSVYNCYFKAKADPEVTEWFPMFSFRSDTDGELKGWIAGEAGYDGWVHNPPKSWMQYLRFHTYAGDVIQPFVRIAPPAGAVAIAASFTYSTLPPADKGCYVDDVVIDKVAANEPLVTTTPDPVTPLLPPAGLSIAAGVPSFQIPTTLGYQYRLVYANALAANMVWTPVGAWTLGTGSLLTLTDASAVGQSPRFYRLQRQ
jgi:hypothetical protein